MKKMNEKKLKKKREEEKEEKNNNNKEFYKGLSIIIITYSLIIYLIKIFRIKKGAEAIPLINTREELFYQIINNNGLIKEYYLITIIIAALTLLIIAITLRKILKTGFLKKSFEKLKITNDEFIIIFLLLTISNPLFLTITINNPLTLITISLFFLTLEKPLLTGFLMILPEGLTFGLISIIYYLFQEKKQTEELNKNFITSFFSFITGLIIGGLYFGINYYFLKKPTGLFNNYYFNDFGNPFGVSFFLIMIALISIFYFYKTLRPYRVSFFLITILLSYFYNIRIILILVTSFLGSLFLENIFKREWHFKDLKKLSTLLIIFLLLFSFLENITFLIKAEPTPELVRTTEYLIKNDYKRIETSNLLRPYFNEKGIIVDNELLYDNNIRGLYERVKKKLEEKRIKAVVINQYLREEFWDSEKKGLLFALEESGYFEKKNFGNYEVWILKEEKE